MPVNHETKRKESMELMNRIHYRKMIRNLRAIFHSLNCSARGRRGTEPQVWRLKKGVVCVKKRIQWLKKATPKGCSSPELTEAPFKRSPESLFRFYGLAEPIGEVDVAGSMKV